MGFEAFTPFTAGTIWNVSIPVNTMLEKCRTETAFELLLTVMIFVHVLDIFIPGFGFKVRADSTF